MLSRYTVNYQRNSDEAVVDMAVALLPMPTDTSDISEDISDEFSSELDPALVP